MRDDSVSPEDSVKIAKTLRDQVISTVERLTRMDADDTTLIGIQFFRALATQSRTITVEPHCSIAHQNMRSSLGESFGDVGSLNDHLIDNEKLLHAGIVTELSAWAKKLSDTETPPPPEYLFLQHAKPAHHNRLCTGGCRGGRITCSGCSGLTTVMCTAYNCRSGKVNCLQCNGTGQRTEVCYRCNGSGSESRMESRQVWDYSSNSQRTETQYVTVTCSSCFGSPRKTMPCGYCTFGSVNCQVCFGTAKIQCPTCAGIGNVSCEQCSGTGYTAVIYDPSATVRVFDKLVPSSNDAASNRFWADDSIIENEASKTLIFRGLEDGALVSRVGLNIPYATANVSVSGISHALLAVGNSYRAIDLGDLISQLLEADLAATETATVNKRNKLLALLLESEANQEIALRHAGVLEAHGSLMTSGIPGSAAQLYAARVGNVLNDAVKRAINRTHGYGLLVALVITAVSALIFPAISQWLFSLPVKFIVMLNTAAVAVYAEWVLRCQGPLAIQVRGKRLMGLMLKRNTRLRVAYFSYVIVAATGIYSATVIAAWFHSLVQSANQ